MGDTSGMNRRFDVATYQAESAGWNVEKLINVAAATGGHSVAETLHLDQLATEAGQDGHPDAIVGGLPPTASTDEAAELLDVQLGASRFRGVRPMGRFDGPLPPLDVLRLVADRGLVFDLMAHTEELHVAADGLAQIDGLAVVIEHTGWPRSDSDDERARWKDGLAALAGLGDRVTCKLSGLAMPLGSMDPTVLGPWIHDAIDTFGVDRCMFASNFPVDGMHGSLDQLFTSFSEITAGLDEASRDQLFASNAERVYRC
jgi:predicted TIM-barrel fold metal-dependent hydrolase